MKIMFICTGNICRSAMAHWLLEEKLKENRINNIEVYSCGIYAQNGDIPTYEAKKVMKDEYGIDISKHRAINIYDSDIEQMDLILCATNIHKMEVKNRYPQLKEKVFTMKEYAKCDDNIDIKDPWGYSIETYKKCISEIQECIDSILLNLKK